MANKKVAVVIGSLRKESINRKMANALIKLAPSDLMLEIVEIGDLSLFNDDLEANAPAAWTTFRDAIKNHDAVLFVTPEYNRSIPAVTKNAIDIGSRPPGKNVWNQKPAAIVTVSPGAMGGVSSANQTRQAMMAVNMITMPQPEVCIGAAGAVFNEDGTLVERTATFMTKFLIAFNAWSETILH